MAQLLVSCVVLYLAILTLQVAADNDWRQKRVKTPFFDQIYQSRRRYRKGGVGDYCRSTSYCRGHLCCMRSRSGMTTCQPRSRFGQTCSDEQTKSGYYLGACPCRSLAAECYVRRRRQNIGTCTPIR
ncbi:uncharacterized protein LOC125760324 [Rhipicephalus sanguineus]|uniref:uncharacterized protein LOC125760324 n=1 Tax=Rhipicephalus sanguineus TaxID=34632 RepID=UPI0020C389DC|nr:uncharacterized protein LOC125760324 [Rhipicephalus sanguineus]